MKYKLRSSSNSTESKSTYHSSGPSSSRGISSGPPEKRLRLEHDAPGPNRGAGHNLRRKPWAPSLISIETQTDERLIEPIPPKVSKCVEGNEKCLKVCELCGCSTKKRLSQKSGASKVVEKDDCQKKEESLESDKTKPSKELKSEAIVSERLELSSLLNDNKDTLTIKTLPQEVSKSFFQTNFGVLELRQTPLILI